MNFSIFNKKINNKSRPFIIAELSANHGNNLQTVYKSLLAAKKNGADAIKIQTYTADSMTFNLKNNNFKIKNGLWKNKYLYDLYKKASTPYNWHQKIFEYSKKIKIPCFSTPFDENAVDLLESLNCPAYKVSSFEMIDLPLINYIINKKKPIIVSTGMASLSEIDDVVKLFKKRKFYNYMLLHCISSYPASLSEMKLKNIEFLKDKYKCQIGLSDHSIGNEAAVWSIIKGATLIEKHFILNNSVDSADKKFSMTPKGLKDLRKKADDAWMSSKDINFGQRLVEKDNIIFRRTLFFSKNKNKGDKLTNYDICRKRPGIGLKPKYLNKIIGKKLSKNVKTGDPVKWNCVK